MSALVLTIAFTAYWLHGTGGGGADFDMVADRDDDGYPILRARHVKGVLREASRRLEAWGQTPAGWRPAGAERASLTDILFGRRPEAQGDGPTVPGCLRFENLRLPAAVGDPGKPQRAAAFFRRINSTRIERSGAAATASLRSEEAVVPCMLHGLVAWDAIHRLIAAPADADLCAAAEPIWREHLENCGLEARSYGAGRTRGYGRARLEVAS